eukprot:GHVL01011656.1.p1 GENE.GHVL01011656.1~~GHVL01011656.1.p1  ORF type:complete len:650 (+),score=58.10 GHVL01011656.1:2073-4022(+)
MKQDNSYPLDEIFDDYKEDHIGKSPVRKILLRWIDSAWATILVLSIIVVDTFMTLDDLINNPGIVCSELKNGRMEFLFPNCDETAPDVRILSGLSHSTILGITVMVEVVLITEVVLRLIALGPKAFFSSKVCILDSFCVVLSAGCAVHPATREWPVTCLRLLGLIFGGLYKRLQKGLRYKVGMNKRRYQDGKFDLDLTYITKRVIAMGVPAMGTEKLYRNPLTEVVEFLNTKHPMRYRLYNLCSERVYPAEKFNNAVCRIPFEDHSVPTLTVLWKFVFDVERFLSLDPENVIAVHCKGGKGRTGLAIAAWLLYAGMCQNYIEALDMFETRRADSHFGEKRQTVSNASQLRYLEYFQVLIQENMRITEIEPTIATIVIIGVKGIKLKQGEDLKEQLWIVITDHPSTRANPSTPANFKRNVLFDSRLGDQWDCWMDSNDYSTVWFRPKQFPRISSDICIEVHWAQCGKAQKPATGTQSLVSETTQNSWTYETARTLMSPVMQVGSIMAGYDMDYEETALVEEDDEDEENFDFDENSYLLSMENKSVNTHLGSVGPRVLLPNVSEKDAANVTPSGVAGKGNRPPKSLAFLSWIHAALATKDLDNQVAEMNDFGDRKLVNLKIGGLEDMLDVSKRFSKFYTPNNTKLFCQLLV